MGFTCEKCGWWADVNGVCVCGYSGRPTTRHDSCTAWKTSIVTNADRIRAMDSDHLIEWFCRGRPCGTCPYGGNVECGIRDWLREEAANENI